MINIGAFAQKGQNYDVTIQFCFTTITWNGFDSNDKVQETREHITLLYYDGDFEFDFSQCFLILQLFPCKQIYIILENDLWKKKRKN